MKVAITLFVFCIAALLALGMVMLYSASMTQVGPRYLMMQLIWCGLGLVTCLTMASIDYALLKKLAIPLLILAVILLIVSPAALVGGLVGGRLPKEGGQLGQLIMAAICGIIVAVPLSCAGFWVSGW